MVAGEESESLVRNRAERPELDLLDAANPDTTDASRSEPKPDTAGQRIIFFR